MSVVRFVTVPSTCIQPMSSRTTAVQWPTCLPSGRVKLRPPIARFFDGRRTPNCTYLHRESPQVVSSRVLNTLTKAGIASFGFPFCAPEQTVTNCEPQSRTQSGSRNFEKSVLPSVKIFVAAKKRQVAATSTVIDPLQHSSSAYFAATSEEMMLAHAAVPTGDVTAPRPPRIYFFPGAVFAGGDGLGEACAGAAAAAAFELAADAW